MLRVVSLIAIIAVPAATLDDVIKVRLDGNAPGTGNAARQAAVENAQAEIVLQTLEGMLASKDLQPLRPLLDGYGAYIQSFQVVSQSEQDGNSHVEVEARVLYNRLRQDAAALLLPTLREPPQALTLIAEQSGGGDALRVTEKGVAEETLNEGLRKAGITIVAGAAYRSRYSEADLVARTSGEDVASMAKLALENRADIAIVGRATVTIAPEVASSNLLSCKAEVTLNLVRADAGELMDTRRADAVVHSVNPDEGAAQAFRDAMAKLVNECVVETVLTAAGRERSPEVFITVELPKNAARVKEMVEHIGQFAGVQHVDELYCSDAMARLRVKYPGPMGPFAEWLAAQQFSDFRLEEQKVYGRDMDLIVVAK